MSLVTPYFPAPVIGSKSRDTAIAGERRRRPWLRIALVIAWLLILGWWTGVMAERLTPSVIGSDVERVP